MITIRMNTARLKLTVEGHAQPEESTEYKEICSAVSALSQALAYTIARYNGGEGAMKAFDYRNDPGNLRIKVFPEPWAERELRHRFQIYGDGMELLAQSHPQSVTMIRDEEKILTKEGNE